MNAGLAYTVKHIQKGLFDTEQAVSRRRTGGIRILELENIVFPALRIQEAGIRRFSLFHGWKLKCVHLVPGVCDDDINRIVEEFRPDGIIASLDRPLPRKLAEKIPMVCFDCAPSFVPDGTPHIVHDAKVTAHIAVRELSKMGLRVYAFMRAAGEWYWSEEREAAFVDEVRSRGGRLETSFRASSAADAAHGIGGGKAFERELRRWVEGLEKPCGVFAANDALAAILLKVCRESGVDVPKDIAVVGVDNNPQFCLKSRPHLTSVVPDWEMGAFMAAETLDMVMRGATVPRRREFRPIGIASRESTKPSRQRVDFRVDLAVDLIRRKACNGLRAADVAYKMGCSRRLAEMRFRDVTGASIQEASRDVRLQNARSMLERTALPIAVVARHCGWKSVPTFCRDFHSATDVSPTECRKKFCAKR